MRRAAAVVGLLLIAGPLAPAIAVAGAFDCRSPEVKRRSGQTQVRPIVRVERVSQRELGASGRLARPLRTRADLFNRRQDMRRIVRNIPDLWRKRIPAHIQPAALRVSHRLSIRGFDTSDAVQVGDIDSRLPIVLRTIPPVVLCKAGSSQIVQGGVVLEMPLDRLPATGTYRVDIDTAVALP